MVPIDYGLIEERRQVMVTLSHEAAVGIDWSKLIAEKPLVDRNQVPLFCCFPKFPELFVLCQTTVQV